MKVLSKENRLHQCELPIVAITGGIACGKSTVSKMIEDQGHLVIDADRLVKEIYQLRESKSFIQNIAPEAITQDTIDFKKLRSLFFSSSELKAKIESYIYSKLPEQFLSKVRHSKASIVFYDVPLLFEKKLDPLVDHILCVYVPRNMQRDRVMARDKITAEEAEKILHQQLNIEDKISRSQTVIDNTSSLENTKNQVLEFLKNLEN
ncbi:MAG: dephospho-CoA kinase [Bdellovibrio sp.]